MASHALQRNADLGAKGVATLTPQGRDCVLKVRSVELIADFWFDWRFDLLAKQLLPINRVKPLVLLDTLSAIL